MVYGCFGTGLNTVVLLVVVVVRMVIASSGWPASVSRRNYFHLSARTASRGSGSRVHHEG